MRNLVLLALGILLSACNAVYSDRPLASNLYVANPVFLRPGQWVFEEPDCKPDPSADCASPPVTFDKRGNGVVREEDGTYRLTFAQGDPALIQVRRPKDRPRYLYLGARPIRFNAEGQVVAMTAWVVQCGPLPKKGATKPDGASSAGDYVTDRPYPGLRVQDTYCMATDVAAVRAAARLSEAEKPMTLKWVSEN